MPTGAIPPSPITPINLRVERFSLEKATGHLDLNTVFNRSSAVPACPMTNVHGGYHQHAYGCALEHALVVMSGSELAPADVKAVQHFMSWLAPDRGEGESLGNPVLRRITALGVMHAAVIELLNADSSNQKLIQCEIRLRQSIVDIAVASGKCKSPPKGGDEGGRTTLVAEHMAKAGKCLRECMSMLDTQAFAGAVVRAVLPEALTEAIGDRLGAQVEKLKEQGATSLKVREVLSADGAEKVRQAVQHLSCSDNFESVQNGILMLLEIPELVVRPEPGTPQSKGPDNAVDRQPPAIPRELLDRGGPILYNNSPTNIDFSKLAKALGGGGLNLESLGNLLQSERDLAYRLGTSDAENQRLLALAEQQDKVLEGKNRKISDLKGRNSELERLLAETTGRLVSWSNGLGKQEGRDSKSSKIVFGNSSDARPEAHVGEPNVGHARSVVHQGGVSTSGGTSTEKHVTAPIIRVSDEEVGEIVPSIPEVSIGVLPRNVATESAIPMNDEAVEYIMPSMPATARAVPVWESVAVDHSDVQVVNGGYNSLNNEFKTYVEALGRDSGPGMREDIREIFNNGERVVSGPGLSNTTVITGDLREFLKKRGGLHHSRGDAGAIVSNGMQRRVGSPRVEFRPMEIHTSELQQMFDALRDARFSGSDSPLRSVLKARKEEEFDKRLLNGKQSLVNTNATPSQENEADILARLERKFPELWAGQGGDNNGVQEPEIPQPVLSEVSSLGQMVSASQTQTPVTDLGGEYKHLLKRASPGGDLSDRHLAKAASANAELFGAKRLGNVPPSDVSLEAVDRRQSAAQSSWMLKAIPYRSSSVASARAFFGERESMEVQKPEGVRFNLNPRIELGSDGQSVGGSTSSQGSAVNEAGPMFLDDPSFREQLIRKRSALKPVGSVADGSRVTNS